MFALQSDPGIALRELPHPQFVLKLLLLLFFTVGFVFFDRLAINFLFPFMRTEFELTNAKIGMLTSALAAFFYIRVIVLMYFAEPSEQGAVVVVPSILTSSTIAVAALATVALGVVPGPVLDLAAHAGEFIR